MGKKFKKSSVDVAEAGGEVTSTEAGGVPERWSSGKKGDVLWHIPVLK